MADYIYQAPPPPEWDASPLLGQSWAALAPLAPFQLADGRARAAYPTTTRVCADRQRLYVRFDCADPDIWGHYTERDQPLYEEEVVELFLAPGSADPTHYFEFEVSPNGVLFDAQIVNMRPGAAIEVRHAWNCGGLEWAAERNDAENRWTAVLTVPWASVAPPGPLPAVWRANFYRIERPHGQPPEFSCWSPTFTEPANFHRPTCFGRLELPFA